MDTSVSVLVGVLVLELASLESAWVLVWVLAWEPVWEPALALTLVSALA